MTKYSFCIELPTKNEKENIRFMIGNIRKRCNYGIIVSDEHSTDGTGKIARSMGVKVFSRKKPGYGSGITLAGFAKQGYELVNAGRMMRDIRRLNRLPNMFHTFLVRLLYGGNITDVNSGMKLMKIGRFVGKITATGCDSTVQTITAALKNGCKIKEVIIPYNDRHGDKRRGRSKIRYRDGLIITWRIIRDRFTK